MFPIDRQRTEFVAAMLRGPDRSVLDVGCATGEQCDALAAAGLRPVGVDVNRSFVRAAQAAFPDIPFRVADMRSLPYRSRFDGLACLGSTLLYARGNAELMRTLRSFHTALRPGGRLLVDVLNASALIARRPFLHRSVHRFPDLGLTATIQHDVDEAAQVLTEQVTWTQGRRRQLDPESRLRLLFPLELTHFLEAAGFERVRMFGDFHMGAAQLRGRRLIATARRTRRIGGRHS